MPPKKDAEAAKIAAAKAQARQEKKDAKAAKDAEKAKEAEDEQKDILKSMSNLVTQGKKAVVDAPDSVLAQIYTTYQALPLKSDLKAVLAKKWKADKSGSWLNSFRESHKEIKTNKSTCAAGWTTSFKIAAEMSMDHESEFFQKQILPTMKTQSHEHWDETQADQNAYKALLTLTHASKYVI